MRLRHTFTPLGWAWIAATTAAIGGFILWSVL